jgi:hypothetical protein
MKIKLLFNTINLDNDMVDPIYIPKSGIIIDKHSGNILYKFTELEMSDFFYFRIEFSHYQYVPMYQSKTCAYKNRMTKRIYNLYLYLDIPAIIHDAIILKILNRKLSYYFAMLQFKEIKQKKNYHTNEKIIGQYINYRYHNHMYLIPWYYYRISNDFVFDLKYKKLLPAKYVTKINFGRKGCIVETNNVRKLIKDHFTSFTEKTLVILPSNMTNLWPNMLTITYDQLVNLKKPEVNNIRKNHNITQLIIHECHVQFLVGIKNLADIIKCEYIWIINSLPLRYYFSVESAPPKLEINDVASISNLWLNFSATTKQKYKTEIIKMLLTKFNQIYTIVTYDTTVKSDTAHPNIGTIKLHMTDFEKYIYGIFNKYYDNWKNKLTNDPDNTYSMTTKKKNYLIESKIYDAVMTLITSVVDDKNVPKFFEYDIKNILSKTINVNRALYTMIDGKKTSGNKLTDLINEKNKLNAKILNYKRYLDGTVYSSFNDKCCPICYSDETLVKTKLICGHFICLECMLNTLSSISKCPVCNEFININKIAIVKDTINKYHSNIISYLKTLDHSTLLLTNLKASANIIFGNEYKIEVININKPNVANKIKNIQKISNIVLLTTPCNIIAPNVFEELDKIIGFFQLFNNKPKITKIRIII